jgi:glucose/arabinose dehydrogenase
MTVPDLSVRTVIGGLTMPVSMAFLDENSFLVLEKSTGRVKRITIAAGQNPTQTTVLDLAVNSASERGLLGIALHPDFPEDPGVYLYWTCTAPVPDTAFTPAMEECADIPAPGPDTTNILATPLLGNRVDRFRWNGTALVFERNIVKLRAFQNDAAPVPTAQNDASQPPAGNHNGGVIRFGPDEKLYIVMGDNGRRGRLQNLRNGPTAPSSDDQFGGPNPDFAHLTGVVIRLNDDGTTPEDNPFFNTGAFIGGQVGISLRKVFAYGIRNSFGMAFDPVSGDLWVQEHGDDTFDELNRVEAGMNGGWVQIMGPVSRLAEFKAIEVARAPSTLQQLRWPPANIAATPDEALARLHLFPGSLYSDPELSWKYAIAPGGIGFVEGTGLGSEYEGDMFMGASRPTLEGGYLMRLNLTNNRQNIATTGSGLADRVADNSDKFDIAESESFLIGRNFGVGTDIHTGPNGNVYVVSLSNGAIYEVFRTNP